MATSIICRALTLLSICAALSACGGGGSYPPGQTDENGRVTIDPPNCAASGACS